MQREYLLAYQGFREIFENNFYPFILRAFPMPSGKASLMP
jgi:hypothetical protein